MKGSMYIHIYS